MSPFAGQASGCCLLDLVGFSSYPSLSLSISIFSFRNLEEVHSLEGHSREEESLGIQEVEAHTLEVDHSLGVADHIQEEAQIQREADTLRDLLEVVQPLVAGHILPRNPVVGTQQRGEDTLEAQLQVAGMLLPEVGSQVEARADPQEPPQEVDIQEEALVAGSRHRSEDLLQEVVQPGELPHRLQDAQVEAPHMHPAGVHHNEHHLVVEHQMGLHMQGADT